MMQLFSALALTFCGLLRGHKKLLDTADGINLSIALIEWKTQDRKKHKDGEGMESKTQECENPSEQNSGVDDASQD